jgi:hypothetical protein
MTAFLWFILGLWVGVSAGVILFACLQVSRDGERRKHTAPQDAAGDERLSPSQRAFIALEIQKLKTFAANARERALRLPTSAQRATHRGVLSCPAPVAQRLRWSTRSHPVA